MEPLNTFVTRHFVIYREVVCFIEWFSSIVSFFGVSIIRGSTVLLYLNHKSL